MRSLTVSCLLALAACGAPAPADRTPAPPPFDKSIVCQAGHPSVKEVPVIFGELKTDPQTRAAEARREFVYGGRVQDERTPGLARVCSTCGYVWNAWDGFWERSSSRPDGFTPALTKFIAGWELLPLEKRSRAPEYWQGVKEGARWERVTFGCSGGIDESKRQLSRLLAALGPATVTQTDKHNVRAKGTWEGAEVELALRYHPSRREGLFTASYRRGALRRPDPD